MTEAEKKYRRDANEWKLRALKAENRIKKMIQLYHLRLHEEINKTKE